MKSNNMELKNMMEKFRGKKKWDENVERKTGN